MAQMELLPRLKRIRNFMDRVALKYAINPLDETETREMIEFRLKQAGYNQTDNIFAEEAIGLIYQHTQGYPRRIAKICHDALETAVMNGQGVIDEQIIRSLIIHDEKI
jgi:general secretion pathway protein A